MVMKLKSDYSFTDSGNYPVRYLVLYESSSFI